MKIKNIFRSAVPRVLRNAVRRPKITAARIIAKAQFQLGCTAKVFVRDDWTLRCHPLCVSEFTLFQSDLAQVEEMSEFIRRCRPGMHFLDVGAHWGIFSLAALRFGGERASVLCFEPSRSASRVLRQNLALNGNTKGARVVTAAAGTCCGNVQMLTTGAGGADYMVIPSEARPDTTAVRQVDLTTACRAADFIPTHMKLDIEGFEEEGLIGAQAILEDHRPVLFLELHGDLIRKRGNSPQRILDLLKSVGYTQWLQNSIRLDEEMLNHKQYNVRMVCLPEGAVEE